MSLTSPTALKIYLLLTVLGGTCSSVNAQSSGQTALPSPSANSNKPLDAKIAQLQSFIKQKQFQQAFELANDLMADWGGEPGYDLLAGQAAYGAGHFQEAVFAFERVLIVKPDVLLARLYLAFSYFQVKNLGAAQKELTKLLQEELKPADAAKVREYLDRITELKEKSVVNHAVNLKLGYSYDSNANSGTTLDNLNSIPVESPFFPIIGGLDESSLEQSDHTADVALNYVYNRKLSQKSGVSFNASYANTRYQEQSQLDREILSLTGSYKDEYWGALINLSGFAQPMILDGEFYRGAYGMAVDATWQLTDKWQWLWGLSYTSVNVNSNDDQDIHQYAYRTRFTWQGDKIHMFELGYGDDDGKQDTAVSVSNGKDFWILSYTFVYPLSNKWLIIASSSYQDIKHDGINPAIGVLREEESFTALLNVDYLINSKWKVSGSLSYTDKDSSVEIYAYDRATAGVSVTRSF